jgi:lysozyme
MSFMQAMMARLRSYANATSHLSLAFFALAAALFLSSHRIETARLWYGVHGVDVSNHQGDIDWPKVAGSGARFAYIKASEGGDFVDRRFQQNWQGAKRAGLAVGAYHYFTRCKSGVEQARNFIAVVPQEADSLPPVLDAEHMSPCKTAPTTYDLQAEIAAFLETAEASFGCRPLVYTTWRFERAHLRDAFPAETYWVSSPFLPPLFKRRSWKLWQYHHNGRRAGIAGAVDLNAFRGTPEEFAAFRRANSCARGQ